MKVGIANIFNSLFERIEKIAFGKNSAIINTIIEETITSQKPTKKVNVEISISGSKFKIILTLPFLFNAFQYLLRRI